MFVDHFSLLAAAGFGADVEDCRHVTLTENVGPKWMQFPLHGHHMFLPRPPINIDPCLPLVSPGECYAVISDLLLSG